MSDENCFATLDLPTSVLISLQALTQPYYMRLGFFEGQYPRAEEYYRKAVSLPIHPGLSGDQWTYIVMKVKARLRPVAIIPARGGSKRIRKKTSGTSMGSHYSDAP